jgi:hypothetical protein
MRDDPILHFVSKCNIGSCLMFIYIHILPYYKLFLYFNVCLSVILDHVSCSFTSISFLTTRCSFNTTLRKTLKVKEKLVVRKDKEANEHETWSNIKLRHTLKVKEQLVVRKDMEVNEHETWSNITLRHTLK